MKQETIQNVKEHKSHVLFAQAKLNRELGTETPATTKGYNLLGEAIKEPTTEKIFLKNVNRTKNDWSKLQRID